MSTVPIPQGATTGETAQHVPIPQGAMVGDQPQTPGLLDRFSAKVGDMYQHGKEFAQQVNESAPATPHIAEQLYKHFTGQPNDLDKIPGKAVLTFLMSGLGEGEAVAPEQVAANRAKVMAEDMAKASDAGPSLSPLQKKFLRVVSPKAANAVEAYETGGAAKAAKSLLPDRAKAVIDLVTHESEAPPAPPTPAAPPVAPKAAPTPEPVQAQAAPPAEAPAPPALGKRAQAKVIKQSNALGPNAQVQQQAATLREIPQLRQQTSDVVDAAVPPTGETKADNLRAKSQIDFHLSRGDVDSAQQALDKASGKPSFPPDAPKSPGNTHDVRYMQPENQAKRFADAQDDAAVQQNMRANLDAHGRMAESEARKEFIARNSTGVTKEDLVNAAGGEMNGPTRYRGDEPVSKPKKVPQPKPLEAVQADIETQAMLMQRAGANPGAIERMKALRMGDYQKQVRAYNAQR